MGLRHVSFMLSFVLVSGCQVAQPPSVLSTETQTATEQTPFVYDPGVKERFVFREKQEHRDYYGFCSTRLVASCWTSSLPYEKYVGLEGYFETGNPLDMDNIGYEGYPVILENGERFYFYFQKWRRLSYEEHRTNFDPPFKYSEDFPFISLSQYEEAKARARALSDVPIVPGSPIHIVSSQVNYGIEKFKLSNGNYISESDLDLIREVCSKYGNTPEMAELLLSMEIEKDAVEGGFDITPKDFVENAGGAGLYIGIYNKRARLRFKVVYYGSDWLFVNSYKVVADNYRWQSPEQRFQRDNSAEHIWEWSDVAALAKHVEVAKALANSKKSIIRFQGHQYHSDVELRNGQKQGISDVLELFRLINVELRH